MTNRVVAAALAFCLLLQLHLVFVQPINWDEFRFLADVHSHARGELSPAMLTFHVHFFGWLTGFDNEIDQIRVARLIMLALEAGSVFMIWTISRRFFEPGAALFAALGYVSFSFVLQNGASFRFDPIVTFLCMLSVALLLSDRLRWTAMAAGGLALGLAVMVSIKTSLALPVIVAVGLYRIADASDRRQALLRLGLAALTSILFLAILYYWHMTTLAAATTADSEAHLAASYRKMIAETSFFPRANYFLRSVTENPLHWLLLILGISTVAASRRVNGRARTFLILSFLLPLGSLFFYRNAYPYFYAFLLAPAAILFAAAGSWNHLKRHLWVPAILMAGGALFHHQLELSAANESESQRQTVEAVHAIFPDPVPYLDRCSMIASFPQAGLFLSTWWIENYQSAQHPIMRNLLARRQPVFLIANSPLFSDVFDARSGARRLLEADRAALRSSFVHHWGPIWVAGKEMVALPREQRFEILIAGPYTIESDHPVSIDGRVRAPGDTMFVGQGHHSIASAAGSQRVVLRWGRRLGRPTGTAPREMIFGRF